MEKNAVTLETSFKISPEVVCRDVQGEEVILDLASGHYFGLDEIGTRLWNDLKAGRELGKTVKKIAAEYEIPEERAAGDALQLLKELKKKRLIR